MENDTFFSFKGVSEGLYKEKGSRFLAFGFPVNSEEEVKAILADLKKKYFDARHHCYAWVLGRDQARYRANDDGEPNHSAGDPILGQIRSHNLSNVLIVVVRYFGGTKLGVSGLITAYKTAAAEAIANNQIVEKIVQTVLHVGFPYLSMNEVMRLVKEYDLQILSQQFEIQCQLKLLVRLSIAEEVLAKFGEINQVEANLED